MWAGQGKKSGVVLPNHLTPIATQHLKGESHTHKGCQSAHRLEVCVQMPVATAETYKAMLSLLQILPLFQF